MTINSVRLRREVNELLDCSAVHVNGIYEKAMDIFARYTAPGVIFSFRASEINGRPHYDAIRYRTLGALDAVGNFVVKRFSGGPILWGPTMDLFRPQANEVNRFKQILFEGPTLDGTPLKNHFLAPHNLTHCFRVILYHDRQFIGWLGTFRTKDQPPFEGGLASALEPLIPALQTAYWSAQQVARRSLPDDEKLAIFSPTGLLEVASPELQSRLTVEVLAQVGALVQSLNQCTADHCARLIEGVDVRVTRLEGGGDSRFVAQFVPPRPILYDPLTPLTATQREIAILAARGLTLPEIGEALNRSANTAKVHMREIYRRLEISSRAELVSLVSG